MKTIDMIIKSSTEF